MCVPFASAGDFCRMRRKKRASEEFVCGRGAHSSCCGSRRVDCVTEGRGSVGEGNVGLSPCWSPTH